MEPDNIINIRPTALIPSTQNNIDEPYNSTKGLNLTLDNKNYILIVSLVRDSKENQELDKIVHFLLKEKNPEDINKTIYYEQNKKLEELINLFPKSSEKNQKPEEYILKQIDNYYSKKYISLLEREESIVVIFNLRIESSEGVIQIKIELNKKEKENSKEELINLLNRKIYKLDKEIENVKKEKKR